MNRDNEDLEAKVLEAIFGVNALARISHFSQISQIHSLTEVRALHWSRSLALYLIDDAGELLVDRLREVSGQWILVAIHRLVEHEEDVIILEHFQRMLFLLQDSVVLQKKIYSFSLPLTFAFLEELLFVWDFATLEPPPPISTNRRLRAAVLSSLFVPLKQRVGSCFATAPAKVVLNEQVENFLNDLHQIFYAGRLSRVSEGVERHVPVSLSFGMGDLYKTIDPQDAHVCYSPALIAACRGAGLFSNSTDYDAIAQQLILLLRACEKPLSLQQFLQRILYRHYAVSEETIGRALYEQKQLLGAPGVAGGVVQMREGMSNVMRFLESEKKALFAFKSFCDHPLLRTWEYTVASFTEAKVGFAQWNLYVALGLDPRAEGGLGSLIFQELNRLQKKLYEEAEAAREAYVVAASQQEMGSYWLSTATREDQAKRIQAEVTSTAFHKNSCKDIYDTKVALLQELPSFADSLYKKINDLFADDFQEAYDPELFSQIVAEYGDAPAGFRLLYKHQRDDPQQWEAIGSGEDFVRALTDFFVCHERDFLELLPSSVLQEAMHDLIAQIIRYIGGVDFLSCACKRILDAHSSLLDPDKKTGYRAEEKKPWAYTSGGDVAQLMSAYFSKKSFTQEKKCVDRIEDLLVFFLETFKNSPAAVATALAENSHRAVIACSPNHAFLLYPGEPLFLQGWQSADFTYAWVQREVVEPNAHFYEQICLTAPEQAWLWEHWLRRLDTVARHMLAILPPDFSQPRTPALWYELCRQKLCVEFHRADRIVVMIQKLESVLLESLPLVHSTQLFACLSRLLAPAGIDMASVFSFDGLEGEDFFPAFFVRRLAQRLMAHSQFPLDIPRQSPHRWLDLQAVREGLGQPRPLLCGDANWVEQRFAFLVSPGAGNLMLWRTNRNVSRGSPMTEWTSFWSPQNKEPWIIFANPLEYAISAYRGL